MAIVLRYFRPSPAAHGKRRPWIPDALGLTVVIGAAFAVILPALIHGTSLGPFDLLSLSGLSHQSGVSIHDTQVSDQIQEFISWTTLAWRQVHEGHLPLWNPYSVLGAPLAFNWQSATFSLPSLVGYLFPLHLAYTAQIIVTLIVAGTGVYVFGRLLHLSVLGCVMAAIAFELSGPFMNWLGWSTAGVMSWVGWLFAAALLVLSGHHRVRAISLFALIVACATYAGFPEALLMLALALMVFVAVILVSRAQGLGGGGPIIRPACDIALAVAAGAALAAPLILPGVQLAAVSTRVTSGFPRTFPLHNLTEIILQGFDWRGASLPIDPIESAAYLGVIVVVLSVMAVAVRWRRPEVIALGVVGVFTAALCFAQPLVSLIDIVPSARTVHWRYALLPMAFALSVLAGVGIDILIRSPRRRTVLSWTGTGFAAAALLLAMLWLFGRGHLPPPQSSIRAKSFVWPTIETVIGLTTIGALIWIAHRRQGQPVEAGRPRSVAVRRWAALALLTCETAFLVAVGAPLWSSSPTFLTPTPAEAVYISAVGSGVVGMGSGACNDYSSLGIVPDVNIDYGIRELAVYDPMTPLAYARSWAMTTGQPVAHHPGGFCPAVTTAAAARRYGVSYVLERAGSPGPQGAVFDKAVGNEELFRIPGAAVATVSTLTPASALPAADAPGTPVPVSNPGPATWRIVTDSKSRQVLRLRLTDVPGWHGSIDGRPLKLQTFSDVMLQARIPPGRHTVELHYWPTSFTIGIVLAACSSVGLAGALLVAWIRDRRHRENGSAPRSG
jgi:hypothetical protein